MKPAEWFDRNKAVITFTLVPILIVVAILAKLEPTVKVNPLDLLSFVLLFTWLFIVPYFSFVRWESSTILYPSGSTTSYAIKVRPVKLFGGDWALITHKGFDSPKRVWPKGDITAGFTSIIACPVRLLETMSHNRVILLRGDPHMMSPGESDSFIKLKEVQRAFLRDPIRSAVVSIVYEASELHEHEPRAHPALDVLSQNLRDFSDSMNAIVRGQHEVLRAELDLYGRIRRAERKEVPPSKP